MKPQAAPFIFVLGYIAGKCFQHWPFTTGGVVGVILLVWFMTVHFSNSSRRRIREHYKDE